jgi:hypothetical protein
VIESKTKRKEGKPENGRNEFTDSPIHRSDFAQAGRSLENGYLRSRRWYLWFSEFGKNTAPNPASAKIYMTITPR